jgi:hypothetical protein
LKKLLLIAALLLACFAVISIFFLRKTEVQKIQEQYTKAQEEHPFSKILQLTKKERKARAITPNKYYEEKYLLEMNPYTGRTHPENLRSLREELKEIRSSMRKSPGDGIDSDWEERGPNNVGGRTRAVLFDPNDATFKRVFAGGVSGGLWVNDDITDVNSSWTQLGIDENLAISCIAVDPNNSQIMYVGTGELYTRNDALGNGVWRSTDGGTTWESVYKVRGTTSGGTVPGTYYTTDIIVRDADGSSATTNDSEVFVAIGASYYDGSPVNTFVGTANYGLFKSIDTGANWNRVTFNNSEGRSEAPNDLEIGSDNTLWIATTVNVYGDSGGSVYNSTNGSTFTLKYTITNARRTEIAVSKTDAGKIYVLAQLTTTSPVGIYLTTDAFATAPTTLALPNDADTGIPANDFTRGQAFYDLMLAVDPTNDAIAYVGGIDLFRTTDSGTAWTQISKWSDNNNLAALNIPKVHADQHGWAFHPTNSNIAVNGNDGGVYYASSLSTASSSTSAISARNKDFNITQFYKGAIGPSTGKEYLLAGAQDNGTQFVNGASTGVNSTTEVFGGDGGYCFIDKDDAYMTVSYVHNVIVRLNLPYTGAGIYISNDQSTGSFINPMELDDNLDILYTSGTSHLARFSGITTTVTRTNFSDALLTNITAIKVSPFTTASSKVFVGTSNGTLVKVENADTATTVAGLTITDISGGSFLGSISCIEFGDSESEIFVTFHNFGVTSIWYTLDGGTNWSSKEGDLPDIPVKAILMNPLNKEEVIIGTELGVWKTSNFGILTPASSPNWTQSYNGMSNVPITSFDLRAADNTILASTYGRGMFTGKFAADAMTTAWTGAVDTDWATVGNWSNGIPTSSADAIIANVTTKPVIGSTVSLRNLVIENESLVTINGTGSLTLSENLTNNGVFIVNSGGSVIVNGRSTGAITYNVAIADTNWHLVSSPVIGEQYDDVWITNNSIASGTGNNRGISYYNNGVPHATTQHWRYFQTADAGTFTNGIGYSNLRTSDGNYSFTGTFPTTDVTPNISQDDNSWNLLGNPYPSYIDIGAFITANAAKLSDAYQAIYVWNGTAYDNLTAGYIHPGQGFFVNSNIVSGTVSITEAMQSHQTGVTFYKTSTPSVNLKVSDGISYKETQINYLDAKTTGLDPRFDIGLFDGASSKLRIYTHLLKDNQRIKFSRQALPNSGLVSMIVPVGVKANAGKEIIFTTDALNLPADINVFLEDKVANTITRLDEEHTAYRVTLIEALNGVGRFFLHTSSQILEVSNVDLVSVSIYSSDKKIHLSGLPNGFSKITLYNVLGKVVLKESTTKNRTSISVKNLSKGAVYIVKLITEKGVMSKKIIIE